MYELIDVESNEIFTVQRSSLEVGDTVEVNKNDITTVYTVLFKNESSDNYGVKRINSFASKSEPTLTGLETMTLRTVPKECFYERGFDSILWSDCFLDTLKSIEGIPQKEARGVLSSLAKKEFIGVDNFDKKNSTLWLKDLGKAWLIRNNVVDSNGNLIKLGDEGQTNRSKSENKVNSGKVYSWFEPETECYFPQPTGCAYFSDEETASKLGIRYKDYLNILSRIEEGYGYDPQGSTCFKTKEACNKAVSLIESYLAEDQARCIMCNKVFPDKDIVWDANAEPTCPFCGNASIEKYSSEPSKEVIIVNLGCIRSTATSYASELGHPDAVYDTSTASWGNLKDEERVRKLPIDSVNKGDRGVVLASKVFNTSKTINGKWVLTDVEICVVLVNNKVKILIDKDGLQELK